MWGSGMRHISSKSSSVFITVCAVSSTMLSARVPELLRFLIHQGFLFRDLGIVVVVTITVIFFFPQIKGIYVTVKYADPHTFKQSKKVSKVCYTFS